MVAFGKLLLFSEAFMKVHENPLSFFSIVVSFYVGILKPFIIMNLCLTGINISPTSNFVQAQLAESSVIPVTISELPAGTAFSLLEVHSVLMNVTVSQTQALTPGQFISGKDVGLVVTGVSSGATPGAYIRNENNVSVNILVILNAYNADGNNRNCKFYWIESVSKCPAISNRLFPFAAPIPGGCNMEVPIKTAPFLPTSFTQNVLTVEFPLGSWPTNVKPATCDRAPLQYDIFIYYLSERDWSERTAFDSIRLMSNVTSIEQYGTKVRCLHCFLLDEPFVVHLRTLV